MIKVTNETLIFIVLIVIGIIILKFLGSSLLRVVALIVMIVIGLVYTYFFTNLFVDHQENKAVKAIEQNVKFVSILEYQKEHCNGSMHTKIDSITCECIISPVVNDMLERLSPEELDSVNRNKQLYLKELMISLKKTEKDILFNLKEKKAIYLWNKMVLNLKDGKGIGEE